MKDDLLLILNVDFDTTSVDNGGQVKYMETTSDLALLGKASKKVEFYTWKPFSATQIFVANYERVKAVKSGKSFT